MRVLPCVGVAVRQCVVQQRVSLFREVIRRTDTRAKERGDNKQDRSRFHADISTSPQQSRFSTPNKDHTPEASLRLEDGLQAPTNQFRDAPKLCLHSGSRVALHCR